MVKEPITADASSAEGDANDRKRSLTAPPWEQLALTAALAEDRALLTVLLQLDHRLEHIVRSSSEPMLGQIRLAWWRDVLSKPTPPRGEPLIADIQAVRQTTAWPLDEVLLDIIEGWETLLLAPEELESSAAKRGGGVFRAFAGPGDWPQLDVAARSWALADVANPVEAPAIGAMRAWPRRLRPLSLLALAGGAEGRFAGLRLSWHGLTGR